MSGSSPSVFSMAMRSFIRSFMAVIGFGLGLIFVLLFFGAIGSAPPEPQAKTDAVVLPNADGERYPLQSDTPIVLKIAIHGFIGGEHLNAETVMTQLQESQEGLFAGQRVKAIVLTINSPGGTVTAAEGIYRALKEYKEKHQIPIYAYIDGLCASGGYYIGLVADKMYASRVSLVGSVGIVTPPFLNFTKTLDKLGVERLNISAGKGKDTLNPFRTWQPGEEQPMVSIVNYYYDQFVDHVVANRPKMNREELSQNYGAHVFPAPLAKEYAFIDEDDASFELTLRDLVAHAQIDSSYQVVTLSERNWLSSLLRGNDELAKVAYSILPLPGEWSYRARNQFLLLYQP